MGLYNSKIGDIRTI